MDDYSLKEINRLQREKEELELFLKTNTTSTSNLDSLNEHLNETFNHSGIVRDSLRIQWLPSDNPIGQNLDVYFTFKSCPTAIIHFNAVVLNKKGSSFLDFADSAFQLSASSQDNDDFNEFKVIHEQISLNVNLSCHIKALNSYLTEFYVRKNAFSDMAEVISAESFHKYIDDTFGWGIVFSFGTDPAITFKWGIVLNNTLLCESVYSLEFNEIGKDKAMEFSFPEEIVMGKSYKHWNAEKCFKEITKLVSFSGGTPTKSISKSKNVPRKKRSRNR